MPSEQEEPSRLWRVTDAAERLHVHRNTVGRWIDEGAIRVIRRGRVRYIPNAELVAFEQRSEVAAP